VDTDQIIPARFLKATTREGFGNNLFADWRYDKEGNPKPDFVLNNPTYSGEILVAGKNFGSGSSREHAAWAIAGYGFKVVVSSFFADYFSQQCAQQRCSSGSRKQQFPEQSFRIGSKNPKATITVDLEAQTIRNNETGEQESFEINAYKKECLLKGLDDIDYLLSNKDKIEAYEKNALFVY